MSWGVHFPMIRYVGELGFNFTSLIAFIIACVSASLLAISAFRKRMPAVTPEALRYYFICGLTGYLLPFCFELYSAPKIGAGVLAIIVTLTPIFTVMLTAAIKAEPITRKKALAVVCGLVAVMPLFDLSDISMGSGYGLGLLVALLVPICYSAYYIFVLKLWPKGMDSWQVATGEAVACAAIIIPFMVINGGQDLSFFSHDKAMMVIGFMVILSVTEVYLYFEIIRRAGVVFVSQANFLAVAMSVLLGVIIFGEVHSIWIFFCLILLGASLALSAKETKAKA